MGDAPFFGLVKFFRDEGHLEQLLDGVLYCNTPEYYRQHRSDGVSDFHESCTHAYRRERGDADCFLSVNGMALEGLTRVTLRATGMKDRWLHCWTCLRMPPDEDALSSFVSDIERLRSEFGLHYAYIRPDMVHPFLDHIQSLTSHKVSGFEVQYSGDSMKWSPACKREEYKYQREYRIMVGTCEDLSVEPLVIRGTDGFRKYIGKDLSIRIGGDNGLVYFQMSGVQALIHGQAEK